MTQTTSQPNAHAYREPTLRVLLIGPASGAALAVENTLRFSRKLLLVRARTCVEAIGELAFSPELEAHKERTQVVVLIADDSVFDADIVESQGISRETRARQFARAASLVAPKAHLSCIDSATIARTIATPIPADNAIETLESVVRVLHSDQTSADESAQLVELASGESVLKDTNHPSDTNTSVHTEPKSGIDQSRVSHALLAFLSGATEATHDEPQDVPQIDARSIIGTTGDEVLANDIMRGQPVLKLALRLIEHRLGSGPVIYQSNKATPSKGSPVSIAGKVVGTLIASPKANAAHVATHAAWLGTWLSLEQSVTQMRCDSFIDPLTGAFNRRFFERELPRIITQGARTHRQVAILAFDIDNFKSFNDRFGHEAGDEILCQTVQLLRSVIRPTDRVCRLGGDEFVVVFYDPDGPRKQSSPNSTPHEMGIEHVRLLVDRVQKSIAQKQFPNLKLNAPGSLSISGGLASIPADGTDPWKVLRIADARALDSKRLGKNTITFGRAHSPNG